MLHSWIFGCHGSMCYVIFINAFFAMYTVGPINMCTEFEINRYKIDKFRKYAKIMFYLTSCDTKTVCRTSWGRQHFVQEHFESYQKSLRLPVFYFLSHTLGMMYWNLHVKFHKNPSGING